MCFNYDFESISSRKYVRAPQRERRKWSHEGLIYHGGCIFKMKKKKKEARKAGKLTAAPTGPPALGTRRGPRKPEVAGCSRGHLTTCDEEGTGGSSRAGQGHVAPSGLPLLPGDAEEGRRPVCGERRSGSRPTWTRGCAAQEPGLCSRKAWGRVEKKWEAHNRKEV